ncbi:MAG: hypothetical protein R3A48_10730 [Polyangiales bacterium]
MSEALTGWPRVKRALSATLPHALVVPAFGAIALLGSSVLAALGTGALVRGFGQAALALTSGGGGGHGYGILAGIAVWAILLVSGAGAAVGFVLLSTACAMSAGMILSGLIDLARLPRAIARTDTLYPKRWGAWAAALSLAAVALASALAAADVGRVSAVEVTVTILLAGPLCGLALLVGLLVRAAARVGENRRSGP